MAKVKQYRWVCPECESAKHAPQAPRMNDVRRYCLPCSEATGYLVERTCPVLDAKRARKKETQRTRAARRAARNKAKRDRERLEAKEAKRQAEEREARYQAKKREREEIQEREEARKREEIDALDPDVDPFDNPLVVDLRDQLLAWAKGTQWTIGRYRGAVVVHGASSVPVWTKLEHRIAFDEALRKHRADRWGVRTTSHPPIIIRMTPTAFCDWAVAVLEELGVGEGS